MKLITKSTDLEKEFLRLQNDYDNFYWLTAWASSNSKSFKSLITHQDKIKKIVVGIHFYQTHPDFIETFLNSANIKYIKQPEGTFHPKIFLFYNDDNDWELLIGSANFTNAAFTINTEATSLISHHDNNAGKLLKDIFALIDDTWESAKPFDKAELDNYKNIWKNYRRKINSLSGKYGSSSVKPSKQSKPLHLVAVASMNWDAFMRRVYNEKYHSLDSRIKVIQIARDLFKKANSFNELTNDERKFIAGVHNNLKVDDGVDWGYFGSMKGAILFVKRIKDNNNYISQALDEIPLAGQITRLHYKRFLRYYQKAFKGTKWKNNLATATRLLAMKRPDIFVCLDSKNRARLCEDFGIAKSGLDYDRYWDEIIERIYDFEWWINPIPKNKKEQEVSKARTAFLDSLYYEE